MSNANRDYAIVYDIKNSSLVLSRPLIFYITDKNTSNIFVRLVTRISIGDGIDQYTDIENATNYALTMRVIKPNNEIKSIQATQHEPESIFQFDLTEDFKDIPGKYICELTISTIVSGRQELATSDPFNYEVKRSILSNVSEIIETEDTTVEKLLNDLDAAKVEFSSQVRNIENEISKPISLNKCDSEMLGAIQNKEGETNFNLLSIPRNNSVSLSKLDSSLQSLIGMSSINIELTVVPSYIWDLDKNGAWSSVNSSDYRGCEAIPVSEGEEYIITGRSVWSANLYMIKDANDNILETFPNVSATGKNYDNIKFIIPNKGTKLCINSYITYPTVLKKITGIEINYNKINSLKDDFVQYNNLDDKLKYIYKEQYKSVNLTFADGGYYQYNTGLIHEHTDFQNCKISVKANECYKISGATSYEANLYMITDSNDNIITAFPNTNEGGKTYENIEFSIPSNGKKLLINQRLSVSKTILQKKVYNIKQPQNGLKWCAFGDSLTDSATLGVANYNYTNFVSKNLGLTLTNCGKGGTGYLANNNNSGLPFWQRVNTIPSDTDILTIFGSFNDMFMSNYNLGTINDTGTDTVYGAIKKMVTEAFKVNDKIRVALITPTPWSGRWRGNPTNGENVIKYVQAIIDVANYYSIPCLNLFDCSNLRPWDNAFNSKYYLNADGTHPNTEGHKFIAPKIENFIKSIILNYN